jgi:hypothetical protein
MQEISGPCASTEYQQQIVPKGVGDGHEVFN